jgi:hypothetical protein
MPFAFGDVEVFVVEFALFEFYHAGLGINGWIKVQVIGVIHIILGLEELQVSISIEGNFSLLPLSILLSKLFVVFLLFFHELSIALAFSLIKYTKFIDWHAFSCNHTFSLLFHILWRADIESWRKNFLWGYIF